jgi:hypothetical protein
VYGDAEVKWKRDDWSLSRVTSIGGGDQNAKNLMISIMSAFPIKALKALMKASRVNAM